MSQTIRTKDNSTSEQILSDDNPLENLAGKSVRGLAGEGDLFLYPAKPKDFDESDILFSLDNERRIQTGNMMGYLGKGGNRLTISSRFAEEDQDYFLHYILLRALNFNIINLEFGTSPAEQYYKLLPFLFPKYLNEAMRKGLYKEYVRRDYNNARINGPIDVGRHIKQNTPFIGKIAFRTREYSYNNAVIHLIRHTIEYMRQSGWGEILGTDAVCKENVRVIEDASVDYRMHDRLKVIKQNRRKQIRHSYFTEYQSLQKLCIRILQGSRQTYGDSDDNVYGIIFDGANLWEEYLDKILRNSFDHSNNRTKTNPKYLFEASEWHRNRGTIYPDFISKEAPFIILDAKYKPKGNIGNQDYLQMIAYMYVLEARKGIYIYPDSMGDGDTEPMIINNRERRHVEKIGVRIPKEREVHSFAEFSEKMKESEQVLLEQLAL